MAYNIFNILKQLEQKIERGDYMAGYIMTIGEGEYIDEFNYLQCSKSQKVFLAKDKAMSECIKNGIYATALKVNSNAKTGTRADYLGMRKGDNIYFFYNRCIYGIGEIVDIDGVCSFYNPADAPLCDRIGDADTHPYICLFKAAPFYFRNGADMDDVLLSNPGAFRKLRFFHNRSFIHLDDKENAALKSYIIQKNEMSLQAFDKNKHYDASQEKSVYDSICRKFLADKKKYTLDAVEVFKEGCSGKKYPNKIKSEFFVEGLILDYVKNNNKLLGYWDFMSRQYVASPNKPAEYADNMDVFGYRYVKGYSKDGIISKYVVIEIKAQEITKDAVLQLMKYVDWVCKEFAHNDYSMIEAYLVGYDMEQDLLDDAELYTRNYIKSSRHNENRGIEVEAVEWKEVKYVSYVDILKEMEGKRI